MNISEGLRRGAQRYGRLANDRQFTHAGASIQIVTVDRGGGDITWTATVASPKGRKSRGFSFQSEAERWAKEQAEQLAGTYKPRDLSKFEVR